MGAPLTCGSAAEAAVCLLAQPLSQPVWLSCFQCTVIMAALSSALQRLQRLVEGRAFESVASTLSSFDPHLEAAADLVDLSRSAAEAGRSAAEAGGSGGNGLRAGFQRFGADRP